MNTEFLAGGLTYAEWLPVIFIGLMGMAVLIYAILDGYDLGVGILLPMDSEHEPQRDIMIASIGPFWDANETWLVLAIGILLIAFPSAHSMILMHLYIPAAIMLIGLIMRGVAFDFRAKAAVDLKLTWDRTFKAGSLLTTLTQGYMLGQYIMGFNTEWNAVAFSCLSALGVTAAYSYVGGAWLVMKTEEELQRRAVSWTKNAGRATFIGVVAVSIVNPLVNPGVFDRWFTYPLVMFVLLIPAATFAIFVFNDRLLARLPKENDRYCRVPFFLSVTIFLLCFTGLAFSFFPEIVPGKLDIWEAASATESLSFILVGTAIVVPLILAYTVLAYRVFHGKASHLKYH
ncbi:cytochrome d ubiquinol oxidase subunit II [Microbulbifer yueqingensis]|uniref:Cytochrome bd-I ubiquinol oxidase subunit 2 apoprotein n=1 Tax=Microbulbifer yueqingensis TaxID=658219 RepID=A0A1G8XV76_9GAMM|nr:cytochrome d ubiquinol oxidase subunit II [Microbulbifer yueqingensis]SDJ93680.1 cytochrome bd-I ubiquinol oxidase subunit 2 apoprotein [Microbulbifer yueqingensis]